MKAMAVEFAAPGLVRLVERDVSQPGAGEALVRTLYSGISSGTESLLYRGELPLGMVLDETISSLRGELSYPVRYGYSCVGVVEDSSFVGPGLVFAFAPHQSHFVARVEDLVPIETVEPRVATLFPLVETALQTSLDAGRIDHEDVVVVGLGAVGLLCGALLARGGARVVGSEPRDWRRARAADFGIEAVEPDLLAAAVDKRTSGRGVPLVVETSGSPDALAACLPLLAHEGTALVVSWYGTRTTSLQLGLDFHRRRLRIQSTQVSTIPARLSHRWTVERRRAVALELMTELPLGSLATHAFPLARAADAFEAVAEGRDGLVHAALEYE